MPSSDTSFKAKALAGGLHNESGLWEALQRFWLKSYAGDYIGVVILIVSYILLQFFAEPFHQQFRLDDSRIQHPFALVERVPISLLIVYAAAAPLALILLWTLTTRSPIHKIHVTILGLLVSIITTTFITDIIKNAVGRPRPDLIARCKPLAGTSPTYLVNISVCSEGNAHILQDGWRSYPSGHSSFAFAGLGWTALFLASQMHVLRPRASLAGSLVCLAPLLGAALIAISRLEDYRHDVFDVVCGSVLGTVVAYFNWRRYYPSLRAGNCEEPFPALPEEDMEGRDSGSGRGVFQRLRDEEQGLGVAGASELRYAGGEGSGYDNGREQG